MLALSFSKDKICNGCIHENKRVDLIAEGVGSVCIVCITCDHRFPSRSAGHKL